MSSTPSRGRKRNKKSRRDSTDSISPIGAPPDISREDSARSSCKVGWENSNRGSEGNKKFKLDDNLEIKHGEAETSLDIFKEGNSSQSEGFLSEVTGDVLHKCSSSKGDMEED